jgi:NADPH oxidase
MSFEWFHDVLRALENQDTGNLLDIRYFLTGQLRPEQVHDIMHSRRRSGRDPITGLNSQTFFGRPNFDAILRQIRENYAYCHIGLFYCGPPKLAKQLSKLCKKYSDSDTTISFHKEHFGQ